MNFLVSESMDLSLDNKYDLITRNLEEVFLDEVIVKKIMEKRPFRIYWGTAPTSQPHIGYLVPILKIVDFVRAGCEVTILLADLHAVLDELKSTFDQIENRTKCYRLMLSSLLETFGVDLSAIRFVTGMEFQLEKKIYFGYVPCEHSDYG